MDSLKIYLESLPREKLKLIAKSYHAEESGNDYTTKILDVMKKSGCVYEEEVKVFEVCLKRQLATSIFDLHEWEMKM